MRGVKPALMSLRCRTCAAPSMVTSIWPRIAGVLANEGPSMAQKRSASRFAAWMSACFVSTQNPSSCVSIVPAGKGCQKIGASRRSVVNNA